MHLEYNKTCISAHYILHQQMQKHRLTKERCSSRGAVTIAVAINRW